MFSFTKMGIVGKIMSGYMLILVVSVVVIAFSLASLFSNKSTDDEVTHVHSPMLLLLKDLNGLVKESYNLTNGWVYQPNQKDKIRLNQIISEEKGNISKALGDIANQSSRQEDKQSLSLLDDQWQALLLAEKEVTQQLASEDDYADDIKVDQGITALEKKVKPAYDSLAVHISRAMVARNNTLEQALIKKSKTYDYIQTTLVIAMVTFIGIITIASFLAIKNVQTPIKSLLETINILSKGKFVDIAIADTKDEIGEMTFSLKNMVEGLRSKSEFAAKIGQGEYESQFELLSEEDAMGKSLLTMRDNLKAAAEEDRRRNWVSHGLAKFVDILRNADGNKALGDQILSQLVRYLNANQGTLFIVNDDDEKNIYLELLSCYAYDRNKFMQKSIRLGEGLVGQAYLEKETIYMTKVPKEYVHITSGLGEATPTAILIVPMKVNDDILGMLEIASFHPFEKYQIEFIEKLGESIASSLSASRTNEKTAKLLAQSTMQTEEMRAQEEEMRQNMEELSATQEEMQRKEQALQEILAETQRKEEEMTKKAYQHQEELDQLKAELELLQTKLERKDTKIQELENKLSVKS